MIAQTVDPNEENVEGFIVEAGERYEMALSIDSSLPNVPPGSHPYSCN